MSELRSGENRPWSGARATVYVAGARVAALLLGADGRAVDAPWVDETSPDRCGVEHLPGPVQGVSAPLADVDVGVARVVVVVTDFGAHPVAQVLSDDGGVAFTITPDRLSSETALVMAEIYRRDGGWKVRALAQGYAGGLPALAAAYGAEVPGGGGPRTATGVVEAGPPPLEDPLRQIAMILEDASRTTASLESTAAYAERRLEQDLEHLVGDPTLRVGPAAEAARAEARRRHDALLGEARTRLNTDLTQLTDELTRLAEVLPPSLAPWSAPSWQGPDAPAPARGTAWAVRLGELAPASAPHFRLPMVRVLPLAPALWVETMADGSDDADGGEVVAARMLAALATRIVVALPHPPQLTMVDVGGRAMPGHVLGHLPTAQPPATDPAAAARLLSEHLEHLELVSMARRSGAYDDLPPRNRIARLLLLPDFPGGLDDASVAAVHQLVAHGAGCGVSVVLSGRRPESLGIPVLDAVHDLCLRVPSASGGDLVDTFGGVSWVFHPDLGPADPREAERVRDVVRRQVSGPERP